MSITEHDPEATELDAQRADVRRRWQQAERARTAHQVALAMLAEHDVVEQGDGWQIVCSRCDHRMTIKDVDRPSSAIGELHEDAHRFALRLVVEHYSRRHPEG